MFPSESFFQAALILQLMQLYSPMFHPIKLSHFQSDTQIPMEPTRMN